MPCIADFRLELIGSQCGCWVHTLVYVLRFGFYGEIVCQLFDGSVHAVAHCADAHSQAQGLAVVCENNVGDFRCATDMRVVCATTAILRHVAVCAHNADERTILDI